MMTFANSTVRVSEPFSPATMSALNSESIQQLLNFGTVSVVLLYNPKQKKKN